jgi:hypothetical protein
MAAYPGLRFQARRAARFEALERWALIGWWSGHFPAEVGPAPDHPGVGMVRIRHGQSGEVVILYHRAVSGVISYGHAASGDLEGAVERAMAELARAEFVLARHRAKGALATVSNYFERRVVHFSTEAGFAEFQDRLRTKPDRPPPVWRTIFDGEIPGPWSQWATVWRHCVEMPTHAFLNQEENYFFW